MNAENFSQYIENPSLLYQMNYEELRQLILQYPYNSNLRYLLAKKSQQEDHRDFNRNLKAAAINSPDRKQLYKILHGEQLLAEEELEERLELKSLQELELEVEETVAFKTETPSLDAEMQFDLSNETLHTKDISVGSLDDTLTFLGVEETEEVEDYDATTIPDQIVDSQENEQLASVADIDFQIEIAEENPIEVMVESDESDEEKTEEIFTSALAPLSRREFQSRITRYQKPNLYMETTPSSSAAQIADQSMEDADDLVTETLADVLTHQQQFEKAIEVYERLSLLFPEKSDFFASRIADIRAQMS
ncbi:MAG: hypothetical protein AAGG68_12485 [Bacteroidota bacterium]